MRLRRRAGRPTLPYMDEVYSDLHRLTELALLLAEDVAESQGYEKKVRVRELRDILARSLERQAKELEDGPPPEP